MKILLIEDEERIGHFLVRGLKEEGHVVSWERDGLAGLQAASTSGHEAIILDLMLPGMDGREICRKLRASGVTTPILMLTALEATADLVKGLHMGADDYLTKPFSFDELAARLSALGRRANGAVQPHLLRVGDLCVDRDGLVVTMKGAPLTLTSLELSLLEFQMEEKGKVVSRPRILQKVWGTTRDPLTNVVDVYVRRLRAQLAPFGASEMIQTIRGRGYCLKTIDGRDAGAENEN